MSHKDSINTNFTQNMLKGVACILVVLNHFHHPGIVGDIEYAISHVGVPIFYLISGYYIFLNDDHKEFSKYKKKISRATINLLIFIAVVLVFQSLMSIYNNQNLTSVFDYLKERITVINICKTLLLSETLFGRGEWFLWGLLQAYILFFSTYMIKPLYVIRKYSIVIGSIILGCHICLRWFLVLVGINKVGIIDMYATYSVRNVWLDAFPFLLIGYGLHKHQDKILARKIKSFSYIVVFGGSMAFSIIEALFLKRINHNVECVLYIGTVFAVLSLFVFSIVYPCKGQRNIFTFIGTNLSMIVYYIHVEVESCVRNVCEIFHFTSTRIFVTLYPLIVIFSVLIAATLIYGIKHLFFLRVLKGQDQR